MKVIYENKALPIDYQIQKNLSPLPHIHKEIEIIYVSKGTSLAFADRQQYKLAEGDLFIAFPNQIHFFEKSTFGIYHVMVMQPELIFGLAGRIAKHCPENNVIHTKVGSTADIIFSRCAETKGELKYTDKLTLETVAREVHLNKYYVSHLLSSKINLTFTAYINNLRISDACELLRKTDKKIANISEDVGFGTIRSFNRAFRRLMNSTPERYREFMKDLT